VYALFRFGTFQPISSFSRSCAAVRRNNRGRRVRGYEKFAVFPIAFSDQRGLKVDSQTSDSLQEGVVGGSGRASRHRSLFSCDEIIFAKSRCVSTARQLASSDAVILGRYVEADALMTMKLEDRVFFDDSMGRGGRHRRLALEH
jgi:hypothetical protein